jgi:hypothetical protein
MEKFVIILLSLLSLHGYAQIPTECCWAQHGFYLGFSVMNQDLGDNTIYRPMALYYHHSNSLTKRNEKNIFSVYYEPQVNPVFFHKKLNIELGVNLGLSFYRKLSGHVYAYASIGSGPHFINSRTHRQAPGFIFSDNLAVGIKKQMTTQIHTWEFNFQLRFRHISNAGLQVPNGGINNSFMIIGLTRYIKRRNNTAPQSF